MVHAVLGYVLITGLAYNMIKKKAEDLNTFEVEGRAASPRGRTAAPRRLISRWSRRQSSLPPPIVQNPDAATAW